MRAAVCRTFREPLVVEDVTLAEPGAGEVRVRMLATAICHSDITFAEGGWGGDLPALYGHEGVGEIVSVGAGVDGLALGERVVVTLIRSCGRCHQCVRGLPVACEGSFALDRRSPFRDANGSPIAQMMATGAFAEEIVVHESQLVAIDDDIRPEVACLLACGVITGFGAVTNTAQMPAGSHAVVIGCGGVGLNAIQAARLSGAQTIVAVDVSPAKLEAANRFGATHAVDAACDDVAARVRTATIGRMADFVFVTVGAKAAYDSSYALLGQGGAMVMVGLPPAGVHTEIDPSTMASYSQRILGSRMGSARIGVDIPALVTLYRQGRLMLDELVTNRYPLEQINEAIASAKQGDTLRNVIVFD